MELEIIEDQARLHAFESEWAAFVERVSPATPFQMPEWLLPWWSHFGSGKLRTLVFRRNGSVTGVLPCFLHQWNGRRQITLLGSGITDYLDPLLEPESVPPIIDAISKRLAAWRDWDLCDWQDPAADTPLRVLGHPAADAPSSVIAVEPSFDQFLAKRPADLKRNMRRLRTKVESLGPVEFSVSEQPEPELLDALVELHGSRWERSGRAA